VHPLSSDLLRVLAPRDESSTYVSVFSRSVSRNAKVSLVFTTSVVRIGEESSLVYPRRHGLLPSSIYQTDTVINVFQQMRQGVLDLGDATSTIPGDVQPLERFLCSVYSPSATAKWIPELRWELFRRKNLDGEKLPPTIGTLIPQIQRANYMSMRDKSYRSPHPVLPDIINHGWTMNPEERLTPLMCLNKPPPIAVLDLIKCGCQTECKGQCSCHKNSLPCTPLCKCYGLGFCIHTPDYRQVKDDDSDAE